MIISRYLTREVLNAMFVVTIVLLLAFLCQQSVRYLNYAAVGKIPADVLLEFIAFEIPYLLAFLLPLGLYLGILFAYGRLYSNNELAIMQMCGFGKQHLRWLTEGIAVFVSLMVLLLMLWMNPWIAGKRQQLAASEEATVHLVQTLVPGRFQVSADGRHVVYVEKLSRDRRQAENVFLAQQKRNAELNADQNPWVLVLANAGYQEKDKQSQDQFFVTVNGYRYEGTPGQNNYKIIQFKKYGIRIPQNDVRVSHPEVETMSLSTLWKNYANPQHAAELQWRLSLPILTFLLAILAVPLSTVKPRQGRFLAFLPAVIIYVVYFNLLFIARRWVEQQSLPASIGMWWVHGLALAFILLVFILFSKRGKV